MVATNYGKWYSVINDAIEKQLYYQGLSEQSIILLWDKIAL